MGTCLIPNCRKEAPSSEPFCFEHRDIEDRDPTYQKRYEATLRNWDVEVNDLRSKLSSALEERDRYKHLAETGTTYVDALAMRNERDALALRLDELQKAWAVRETYLVGARHEEHERANAAERRLDSTTSALGEQSALAAELSLKLLAETNRGHDLQEQLAALQSTEHCANAHDNTETCGWCQRDELLALLDRPGLTEFGVVSEMVALQKVWADQRGQRNGTELAVPSTAVLSRESAGAAGSVSPCTHWVGEVRDDVTHAMCRKCGEMIELIRRAVVENPVTIATDRTNERQTCNHCGNPVPCACW